MNAFNIPCERNTPVENAFNISHKCHSVNKQ